MNLLKDQVIDKEIINKNVFENLDKNMLLDLSYDIINNNEFSKLNKNTLDILNKNVDTIYLVISKYGIAAGILHSFTPYGFKFLNIVNSTNLTIVKTNCI